VIVVVVVFALSRSQWTQYCNLVLVTVDSVLYPGPGPSGPSNLVLVPVDPVLNPPVSSGVLVVNVTWRKRTYVGTLLDCTKHDWAPPR